MAWKKFTSPKSKFDERINLTKSYSFGIPSGFCKKYSLSGVLFVELFYDDENRRIGFHFTPEKSTASYAVNFSDDGKSATITCKSFYTSNGIKPEKVAGKYEVEVEENTEFGTLYSITTKDIPAE